MGCLTVTYGRKGGMEAEALRVGGLDASALRYGGICATADRLGGICAESSRIGGIDVTAALVCAVHHKARIKVTPVETQWVDVNLEAQYDIVYPWDWRIE